MKKHMSIITLAPPITKKELGEIGTVEDLDFKIIEVCQEIQGILGTRNLEATYQRALKVELEALGIEIEMESVITLMYKGHAIGTRRADMILTLKDSSKVIVELKAVSSLNGEHLKQLV